MAAVINDESMVYYAEGVLFVRFQPERFATIQDTRAFVRYVHESKFYRTKWPAAAKGAPLTVQLTRQYRESGAEPWNHRIWFSRFHLNSFVALHELAHFAAGPEINRQHHGPKFCGAYLALLKRFAGPEQERCLRNAFSAVDVKFERI